MENPATPSAEKKENKNRKFIIIIFLLLGIIGVETYYIFTQKQEIKEKIVYIENVEAEQQNLTAELEDMHEQYEDMKTDNEEMNKQLTEQQQKIEELMKEAEKHKNDAAIIAKLKKEANTLREIMKGYIKTIDSLNTLNITLKAENENVRKDLQTEKKKLSAVAEEKENLAGQVKLGSVLKADNVTSIAQRVKSNGVHRETTKAGRTDKIKTCFILRENKIAKPGTKTIYVRVITPAGKVIADVADEEHMFTYNNGIKGLFSTKKQFEYSNQDMSDCIYLDINSELPAGEYIIELYCEEAEIGRSSFTLK